MSSAPTREERARCWSGRDAYFGCLDAAGVLVAGNEQASVCANEKKGYEGNCAKSWVEYFNKRRLMEARQRAALDAAEMQRSGAAS